MLALPRHARVTPEVAVDDEEGFLTCRLPRDLDPVQAERAQIILESMVTGLVEIAREYGDYIEVKEVVQE